MLFSAQQHFEASFARWLNRLREMDPLGESLIRQRLEPAGEFLAAAAERIEDLRFSLELGFPLKLTLEGGREKCEVDVRHPFAVHLVLNPRRGRYMGESFGHASGTQCGPEAILFFGNLFGDLDGVVANRAE